jgi:hypothetical protein
VGRRPSIWSSSLATSLRSEHSTWGEGRAWLGDATWKRLDRATVEVLVGGKV